MLCGPSLSPSAVSMGGVSPRVAALGGGAGGAPCPGVWLCACPSVLLRVPSLPHYRSPHALFKPTCEREKNGFHSMYDHHDDHHSAA
jgi:hypothetical protein